MRKMAAVAYRISPKAYLTLSYFHNRGKWPNLSRPKDLSEIIFHEILTGNINEYAPYVDKLRAREYFKEWGYDAYLPAIYGIWEKPDEIDFSSLPGKFVLKTNHGCGSHYICRDKSRLEPEMAKERMNTAIHTRFGRAETQYHHITPRIYAEEYIEDPSRDLPLDYKFMCCDGDLRCVLICSERATGTRLSTYSLEWEEMDLLREYEKSKHHFEKPKSFEKMREIAADIARRFPHVRVDMYNLDGRILLGELTFTPEGGIMKYFKNDALAYLGHLKKPGAAGQGERR